jgi:ketosteroid isomerase-like protein
MKNILNRLLCIALPFILASCENHRSETPPTVTADSLRFATLIESWNKAHNEKDSSSLDEQYDDSILFYGVNAERKKCISLKCALFRKYPAFEQHTSGPVRIERLSENECKCSFGKKVKLKNNAVTYPAYLVFRKTKQGWKIRTESDLATDHFLDSRKDGSLQNKTLMPADSVLTLNEIDFRKEI